MPEATVSAKDQVRQFVLDYARGRGITTVTDEESLLKNNVVDSLGVFRMIAYLEDTFPITIEDTDMVPENFQTINDIEAFVVSKLNKGNGEAGQCAHPPAMAQN